MNIANHKLAFWLDIELNGAVCGNLGFNPSINIHVVDLNKVLGSKNIL
jgi:hypothetical protein